MHSSFLFREAPRGAEYAGGAALDDQIRFAREWRALRHDASERGVRIIGDLPLYVAADGVDVAAHPELFDPAHVGGAPPDYFTASGQLWGNPCFDWRPGLPLFRAATAELGRLPVIGEDLGIITPAVDHLRESIDAPGMRVLQFGLESRGRNALSRHPEHCVAYTGTHDNDPLAAWWRSAPAARGRRRRRFCGAPASTSRLPTGR